MLRSVVRDIKLLKIQGAENVAKQSVKALHTVLHKSKAHTSLQLISELNHAKKLLIEARPTEPCMRNALNFVMNVSKKDIIHTVREFDANVKYVRDYFKEAERRIAEYGKYKIHNKSVVFTHCHSSTVMMVIAKAKYSGKRIEVHNCETRPLFQGRKTAKELSSLGIKVFHYVDSAARAALKKADVFLFGADAIQSDGRIINKIGTELMLEVAKQYDIPSYSCAVSWKFDPLTIYGIDEPMENRNRDEVWKGAPKKVTIMNPAFEIIEPMLVTGLISELGIYKPQVFVDQVRREHKWMFRR